MATDQLFNALNANFANASISLANATATVTCGTALSNATVQGKFITSALAASATALAFVSPTDGTTSVSATNLTTSQACIIVHCVNAAGARKELQGNIVPYDATSGTITGVMKFPDVPDTLTPIAYSTVKNGTNAAFTFGTTNWNATGVTAATVNVSTLPRRPLTS